MQRSVGGMVRAAHRLLALEGGISRDKRPWSAIAQENVGVTASDVIQLDLPHDGATGCHILVRCSFLEDLHARRHDGRKHIWLEVLYVHGWYFPDRIIWVDT